MAQHARTTSRASGILLETATLLLAALTALTVIARNAPEPPARRLAPAPALRQPAPASGPAAGTETAQQAAMREILRDMQLHD